MKEGVVVFLYIEAYSIVSTICSGAISDARLPSHLAFLRISLKLMKPVEEAGHD